MKKITKEDFKKYMFKLLQTLIIGVCVGLVVGLYQLIVTNVTTLSRYLYGNESILVVCVVVIVSIGFAVANNFILKFFPGVDGSGIPNIELGIRGKKKIEWKFEILFMAINSFISTFAGFPLGSEGPSVVMAGVGDSGGAFMVFSAYVAGVIYSLVSFWRAINKLHRSRIDIHRFRSYGTIEYVKERQDKTWVR